MSDTPRTDKAELDSAEFSDWGVGPSGYCRADFARQLERELAAAQKDAGRWAWYVSNPAWETEAWLGSALPHEIELAIDEAMKANG